ncbi:hypothetical protein [Nocardioides sp. cx-173]|uniref:hypothetical protein n=1 Tax=Nocardioides sp. cx-173 TaxID=2898796 RepID=UPI001E4C07A1|nr:hypothetical protein [Nocardioides sp. cx-173]MCD4525232.1 hypothetical protein [Nocardioides sp. cx-173]UGB40965.1 hypothetical protein LQ940_16505 [Nocardioides sp. cx-173]
MSRADRRPVIVRNAFANDDLGAVERLFLLTVVHLATEYVDGERRPGSRGMDERGHFALHYDYLARALHTSPTNAKKLTQRLVAKGYLSKVNPGTFGRPAAFQAMNVRGDTACLITYRAFVPPYGSEVPPTRGDMASPLTYRTPDLSDPAPSSRVSPAADRQVLGSYEEIAEHPVAASSRGCQWHDEASPCPEDCANHPTSRRRTA